MIAGSCHCGAVRSELSATPQWLTRCNCSYGYRVVRKLDAAGNAVFGEQRATRRKPPWCGASSGSSPRIPGIGV